MATFEPPLISLHRLDALKRQEKTRKSTFQEI
jgi:hypothetical protein